MMSAIEFAKVVVPPNRLEEATPSQLGEFDQLNVQ